MLHVLDYRSILATIFVILAILVSQPSVAANKQDPAKKSGDVKTSSTKKEASKPDTKNIFPKDVKRQQTGYCCLEGDLVETDPVSCRKQQGQFFSGKTQAQLSCTGYCCHDGKVTKERKDMCLGKLKGIFFVDRRAASEKCQGWCCAEYAVSSADLNECRKAEGTFFSDRRHADLFCKQQKGPCCINGEIEDLNRMECQKEKGAFYEDMKEAAVKCRVESGHCNIAGQTIRLTEKECTVRQGEYFKDKQKAGLALRLKATKTVREGASAPGYCCINGSLLIASRATCDKRKGLHFSSEEIASKKCQSEGGTLEVVRGKPEMIQSSVIPAKIPDFTDADPDLAVGDVYADSDCTLNVVILNQGGHISENDFKKSRLLISVGPYTKLPASQQYLHQFDRNGKLRQSGSSIDIDTGLVLAGKKGALIWLDSNNDIAESNEKNNRAAHKVTCTIDERTLSTSKKPQLPKLASEIVKEAREMELTTSGISKIPNPGAPEQVPRIAGDIFGLNITEPLRGGYITRGQAVKVAYDHIGDRGTACQDQENVSVHLLGAGGYNRLLFSGPEQVEGDGRIVELEGSAFSDVPDGDHYTIRVEKAVSGSSEGGCSGESWEFSVGSIRDMGSSGDLVPGEMYLEILSPNSGQTIRSGESYTLRWRVLPDRLPALPSFNLIMDMLPLGTGMYAFSLGEDDFDFDNETRIYSATIPVTCRIRGTSAQLTLHYLNEAYDTVSGVIMDSLPVYGTSIVIQNPSPGTVAHANGSLSVSWDLDSHLQACAAQEELSQMVALCHGDDAELCTPQGTFGMSTRATSLRLPPEMRGEFRVKIAIHSPSGEQLDSATSENFNVIEPLSQTPPTFLWPERSHSHSLVRGRTYTIRWAGMEDATPSQTVDVQLYSLPGGFVETIGTTSVSTGQFNWHIPLCDTRLQDKAFFIKLRTSNSDEALNPMSDALSIVAPQLDFINNAATAGSRWRFGSTQTIQWRVNPELPDGLTIDLYLYKGGEPWLTIARNVPAANGQFPWTVGSEYSASGADLYAPYGTGVMGGVPNPESDDYSFRIQSPECPAIIGATGPTVTLHN